jgi:hypothetical protein
MNNFAQMVAMSVGVVFAGCSVPTSSRPNPIAIVHPDAELGVSNLLAEIQTINFDDGVDVTEANLLAKHYFHNTYGLCGMWGPVREERETWYFPCARGFVASGKPGITIAKNGCRITCRQGPEVTDPVLLAKPFNPAWFKSPFRRRSM